jgi:hypothetical protein
MSLKVVPYEPGHVSAVRDFNARVRHASPFLLPERAPVTRSQAGPRVQTHYLAVADDGTVRGGVLCVEQSARVGAERRPVINLQSPLSESVADPRHAMVGPLLIRHVLRLNPLAYVVWAIRATRCRECSRRWAGRSGRYRSTS